MSVIGETIIIVGYGILMPAAFVICLIWLIRDLRAASQLRTAGATTDGQITSHRRGIILTRGGTYFVEYKFVISDAASHRQVYKSQQEVFPAHYRKLKIGTPVQVSYLPSSPQTSRLAGSNMTHAGRLRIFSYAMLLGWLWLAILLKIASG